MKELFSKKTYRLMKIAKELVVKQRELEMQDIIRFNSCSLKTAYDDVHYGLENFDHIFSDFSNGIISSETTSIADLMILKREMFHEEPKMKILMNIALYPDYKTIDHAVSLDYSESFIRNNIKLINQVINQFNVYITYCDTLYTYQLVGKHEVSVVLFLAQLFKVSGSEALLPTMTGGHDNIFHETIQKLSINMTPFNEYEINLIGKISSMRRQQGFIHKYEDLTTVIFKFHDKYYTYLKSIIDSMMIRNSFDLTKEEASDLISTIMVIGIKLEFNGNLIDNCFNRYDYFYENFKKTNPAWCLLYEKELTILQILSGIDFYKYASEIFFNSFNLLINKAPIKESKIGVYSDFGKYHESTLITLLKNNFQDQNLLPYSIDETYDLIISTTSRIKATAEVILVSDIPSAKDVVNIYNRIYYRNDQ